MGKKSSKNIGRNNLKIRNNSKTIIESKNNVSKDDDSKRKKFEEKLLELSDDGIDALFEAGKIDQSEYEYILAFRKKQKERKKTQKEKFEERIRCNNSIIQKVVNLGRKFRIQEMFQKQEIASRKSSDLEMDLDEQDIERDERLRETRK